MPIAPSKTSSADILKEKGHVYEPEDAQFAPLKKSPFGRLSSDEVLVEDRFGELDRRDSIPAESRDLGPIGPIVREVGEKLKRA